MCIYIYTYIYIHIYIYRCIQINMQRCWYVFVHVYVPLLYRDTGWDRLWSAAAAGSDVEKLPLCWRRCRGKWCPPKTPWHGSGMAALWPQAQRGGGVIHVPLGWNGASMHNGIFGANSMGFHAIEWDLMRLSRKFMGFIGYIGSKNRDEIGFSQ